MACFEIQIPAAGGAVATALAAATTSSRKRSHDEVFDELADLEEPCSVPLDFEASTQRADEYDRLRGRDEGSGNQVEEEAHQVRPSTETKVDEWMRKAESSSVPVHGFVDRLQRERSMSSELSDARSMTPSLRGGSPGVGAGSYASSIPSAFAALNGSAPPPPKKSKLTFQEKEMRRINKEIKDQERAAEKARRDAEKQAHAEEKAKKDADREAERRKKEAEREEKRLAAVAEKAAKEEMRRKKEEEKQKAEDEKRKKEEEKRQKEEKKSKGQMKLGSFFPIPAAKDRGRASSVGSKERSSMSPAPTNPIQNAFASPLASTPSKPTQTPYEKTFPPFFIRDDTTVAPITRFERDEDATEIIQKAIDSYLYESRSPGRRRDFDAQKLFHLPNITTRGVKCMPVKEIMEEMSGGSSRPIDLTTDSQNSQIKRRTNLLKKVPMKFLCFREDVRPPYRGTYTSRPVHGVARLARNPLRKDLPETNYDYDSEAEWVEDEDAEDLKSEADDEEDADDDEDMDGFLDDENDESAQSRRQVLQGDLEPVSTGLCWEDRRRKSSNVKMMAYRMEIILDTAIKSIDPFSTSYWESSPKTKAMDPPRIPLNTMKTPNSNTPTIKSVKPFFTPISEQARQSNSPSQQSADCKPAQQPSTVPVTTTSANQKPKKLISDHDMPAFKAAIEGSDLSKVGLIEVLKKKFPGRSAAAIKASLEVVAKRVGQKEVDKRWVVVSASAGS